MPNRHTLPASAAALVLFAEASDEERVTTVVAILTRHTLPAASVLPIARLILDRDTDQLRQVLADVLPPGVT